MTSYTFLRLYTDPTTHHILGSSGAITSIFFNLLEDQLVTTSIDKLLVRKNIAGHPALWCVAGFQAGFGIFLRFAACIDSIIQLLLIACSRLRHAHEWTKPPDG